MLFSSVLEGHDPTAGSQAHPWGATRLHQERRAQWRLEDYTAGGRWSFWQKTRRVCHWRWLSSVTRCNGSTR
jgi:hypothetical protein